MAAPRITGVDTTALLANGLNHPNAEMHKVFANKLYDVILCRNILKASGYDQSAIVGQTVQSAVQVIRCMASASSTAGI